MIYVCNHGHVADVGLLVHDGTDLVDGKVHLRRCDGEKKGVKRIDRQKNLTNEIFMTNRDMKVQ